MMRVAGIAAAAAVSAVGAAQAVVVLENHAPQAKPHELVLNAQVAPPPAATGGAAQVLKGDDGHYWAEATVNGSTVRFLVDTGASAVALKPEDAQRLGLSPTSLTYDYKVTTASGEARAAKVKLTSVSVSGAEVRDVDAFVIESGLQTSLLGMTYLGRLSRFEANQSALILTP